MMKKENKNSYDWIVGCKFPTALGPFRPISLELRL